MNNTPEEAFNNFSDPMRNVMFHALRAHVAEFCRDYTPDQYTPLPHAAEEYLDGMLRAAFLAGWEAYHAENQNHMFEMGVMPTGSYQAIIDATTAYRERDAE